VTGTDQIVPANSHTPSSAIPAGELRVLGLFNTIRRAVTEIWPSQILVRAFFSDVTLDLRECELPPMCTIDIGAWFATVTIIAPPDVHVEVDVFTVVGETKRPKKGSASAAVPGAPRVSVIGNAQVATVYLKVKARGAR
jgi:hypothetical protein